ncbi:TadE/TadG family type IV pilus assembly protein [Streptomyces sp. NPDC059618]|uniref:TadE/TadG family type IV pilus assembly protein n=1 Tax=Streptomyces sp. NPDC059618 TaxID=3346887 RepID=UPI0036982FEA
MRTHPRTASGGRGRAGTSHVRRSRSDRPTLHTAPTSDPAATDGCTGTPPTHHAAVPEPAAAPARRLRDDRGVSILEFVGFLPILLLVGLAAVQLGLIGYGVNQAGSGARAAARVASQGGDGGAAGRAAVSGWLDPRVTPDEGAETTTATVRVHVPGVIPLFGGYDVTRHATMPTDD